MLLVVKTASILLKNKLEENTDHFLTNSQIHYLKKVLKIHENQDFNVFDGMGHKGACRFISKDQIRILKVKTFPKAFKTDVLIPYMKKTQFEFCLQKIIEVGVNNVFCYISEKTLDKYHVEHIREKFNRYQDIVESAFLQSESKYLPNIIFITSLSEFRFEDYSKVCVLNQNAKRKISPEDNWNLIISGGEFGFSENELAFLKKTKASFVKLSENILRAETAPLVALSIQNI